MLSQFRRANRFFRRQRPVAESCTHCEAFRQGHLLEVAVPALRCCHDAAGDCMMCNYGCGTPLHSRSELESQFDAWINAMATDLEILILCTNGSFLDDRNVPPDIQQSLLQRAQKSTASMVIIETHLDTLSPEKLRMIRQYIPSKQVILEVGLESADPFVQRNCFLKEIPLDILRSTMNNSRELNLAYQLNIILGAPFLSEAEQFEDAEHSVRWALEHGAYAALFPLNIKPYTLLQYAYTKGLYHPISHWTMPMLLHRFSPNELERIDLAWYGNRQIDYNIPGVSTIFPQDCPACREKLQDFYHAYVLTDDGKRRHALVEDILSAGPQLCSCMAEAQQRRHHDAGSREARVGALQSSLLAELQRDQIIEKD